MALSHSPKIVTDGLVLCLDARDGKSYSGSGTTWYDRSGNGNNVEIINGPSFSNGEFTLDADADFRAGSNFMGTTDATNVSYSFSMKFNWGTPTGYKTIFGFQQSSFNRVANFVLNTNKDELEFDLRTGGTLNRDIFQYNMSSYANQTVLISYTFNSGEHKLYINGDNVSTQSHSLSTFPTFIEGGIGGFCVGNNLASRRRLQEGTFSHILVYLKTLTPQEIQQNYKAIKGRFGL
jgi:hypothetical protein